MRRWIRYWRADREAYRRLMGVSRREIKRLKASDKARRREEKLRGIV